LKRHGSAAARAMVNARVFACLHKRNQTGSSLTQEASAHWRAICEVNLIFDCLPAWKAILPGKHRRESTLIPMPATATKTMVAVTPVDNPLARDGHRGDLARGHTSVVAASWFVLQPAL
jgi:hypothetical protein